MNKKFNKEFFYDTSFDDYAYPKNNRQYPPRFFEEELRRQQEQGRLLHQRFEEGLRKYATDLEQFTQNLEVFNQTVIEALRLQK